MTIPRSALLLGLSGLIPFLWGAATTLYGGFAEAIPIVVSPGFTGPSVLVAYGAVILSFMSGVLWGFATRAKDRQGLGYALSTLPALWVFFMAQGSTQSAIIALIAGFLGLLILDGLFARWGLAPAWWMRLRLLLTSIVVLSLASAFV